MPRFWPETWQTRWARRWRAIRWWLALALLLGAAELARRWWNPAPPPPESTRARIDAPFTRCGKGRGIYCVIDGDTIRIGQRSLRIKGIDAPEVREPRCPEEARMGEAASAELLALLNRSPFDLIEQPGLRDDYGRELADLVRTGPDGKAVSLADLMVQSGKVRAYGFGPREGWCG